MTRQTQLLGSEAWGQDSTGYVADPSIGSQMGWSNDFTTWQNNQAYVMRPMVGLVMEQPGFFNYMTNPEKWTQTLRSMFEGRARSMEGMHSGIEVEFDDHPAGGAGEQQSEPVNARRQVSDPVIQINDLMGLPYQNFLRCWIMYGIIDPDSKVALAATLDNAPDGPWTPDLYTATVLFFEPDMAFRKVNKAWLCTNMMPKSNGEEDGRRDLTTPGELLNLNISFTALTQTGVGVRVLAQQMLDDLRSNNAIAFNRDAFITGQEADVAAVANGFFDQMAEVADSQVATPVSP